MKAYTYQTFLGTKLTTTSDRELTGQHWTLKRRNLLQWFNKSARSLGELYEGAVIMIFEVPVPGRVRFVAHAIREICNRLPVEIAGLQNSPRVEYMNMCDTIYNVWNTLPRWTAPDIPADDDSATPSKPEMVSVPRPLVKLLDGLMIKHERARFRPRDNARQLFQALTTIESHSEGRIDVLTGRWKSIGGAAVGRCHDNGKPDDESDLAELRRQLELLEDILAALVQGFFSTLDELNAILQDTNS